MNLELSTSNGSSSDGVKDSNNNNATVPSKEVEMNGGIISNRIGTPSKQLLRQKSRNQLNLNFVANNSVNNAIIPTTIVNGLGSVKPNGATAITQPTSFLQKSFMTFQSKSGLLKRANSVMINYSPAAVQQTPTGVSSTIFGRGKLVATPSFSVIDINTHHEMLNGNSSVIKATSPPEQQQTLQIDGNNSYMSR